MSAKDFELRTTSDVGLELSARSVGASWARKGDEAAAVVVEVDRQYNQDVLLWAGDGPFIYRLSLGQLSAGKHTVSVRLSSSHSSPAASEAKVISLRLIKYAEESRYTSDDLAALANSPVLYQRPNSVDRFSDVPILMYYEVFHPNEHDLLIRYTTIFTNEDGGTETAALMARWGRASDIEWTYELVIRDGKIAEQRYQGTSHRTKDFQGERFNNHPILLVASDNNNFSDSGHSELRFALLPVAADLRTASRETVMDRNPWSYRIVAEELVREGKLKPNATDMNTIADPRDYIYVDLHAKQNGSAISVELKGSPEDQASWSDLGQSKLRIDRGGDFRTAIKGLRSNSVGALTSISVHCFSELGKPCEEVQVKQVSILTSDYQPRVLKIKQAPAATLRPGERLEILLIKPSF